MGAAKTLCCASTAFFNSISRGNTPASAMMRNPAASTLLPPSCRSGLPVPYRLDTAEQLAAAIRQQHALGLEQGILIANPPPAGAALEAEHLDRWIRQAVEESAAQGVLGKELTPYLLQRIEALSGGASLEANVALMLNNARLGAMIAVALAGKMDT